MTGKQNKLFQDHLYDNKKIKRLVQEIIIKKNAVNYIWSYKRHGISKVNSLREVSEY